MQKNERKAKWNQNDIKVQIGSTIFVYFFLLPHFECQGSPPFIRVSEKLTTHHSTWDRNGKHLRHSHSLHRIRKWKSWFEFRKYFPNSKEYWKKWHEIEKFLFLTNQIVFMFWVKNFFLGCRLCTAVVSEWSKEFDSKSNGVSPHRFESCSLRYFF